MMRNHQKPWDFHALWYWWDVHGFLDFDLELRCCFKPTNCQTTEMKPDLAAMISKQDRNIWACLWKLGIHLNSYFHGEYDYQLLDFRVPYFQTNHSIFSGDQHWSAGSNPSRLVLHKLQVWPGCDAWVWGIFQAPGTTHVCQFQPLLVIPFL